MKKVRDEYKMTELGEIPSEWHIEVLGECSNVTKLAGFEFTEYMEYIDDGEIIALRALNLKNGKLNLEDIKKIDKKVSESLTRSKLYINDVLFSYVGTVGEVALIEENDKFHLAPNVAKLTFNDSIVPKFALQYLMSSNMRNEINRYVTTTSQPALSMENIRKLKIIVPKKEEQEKISFILSTVDEQIDNVDALIEKNKELKKGLMQTLLIKGIGHTKFKKTEIGEIPEEWELESMNKIVTSTQLGTNTLGKENEKIPMLKMGNLTIGGFDFNKLEYISEEELEMNKEYILSNGDFLFNTRNTLELVGKSAVWNSQIDKAIFNSNIMRIKYCSKINDFYMGYYFSSDIGWKQLKSISTGTTSVAAIYTKDLMKIKVIIPSIGEQEKIVSILLEVDKKIEEYENNKQKLEELKKGLMQQLLTGKIRVI